MTKTMVFRVGMTCGGCKSAVGRILGKIDGIASFEADVEAKTVTVVGTADKDEIMDKLGKWAKTAGKELAFVGET